MNQIRAYIGKLLRSMLVLVLVSAGSSLAQANQAVTDNVVARLVSEQSIVQPGASFSVALQLDIRDGWHTYWRNPGDSGQATSIRWNLPDGITAGEIQWPFPERQYVGPVANYGYHGTAMHLVELQLSEDWPAGKPIVLHADANWLVCEEECIPESGSVSLQVATGELARVDPIQAPVFNKLRETLPNSLAIASGYQYAADGRGLRLEFAAHAKLSKATKLEYFPFDWGFVSAPAEQQVIIDDAFVSITTTKGDLVFSNVVGGLLVATSTSGAQQAFAVESTAGPLFTDASLPNTASKESVNAPTSQPLGLLAALVLALLGGVILNLMPCVFPVLFIKALSLVSRSGEQAASNRRHGLAYTFGILVCFMVLGFALIMIRAAGQQVGWGFQLQSPVFVSLVAMVLFVLGLSLSGFVEIGTSFMGAGSSLASRPGYRGSFFTGVLAVVVATPCTAPFMGPAIGFAVTQSAPVTISVLLALGVGLALPYLVLSFVPALTHFLPRPGVWMQRVQQLLAFPLYASAAWLVWVLGQQSGINGVFVLLMLFILAALVIWVWQVTQPVRGAWQWFGRVSAVLLVMVMISLFAMLDSKSSRGFNGVSQGDPSSRSNAGSQGTDYKVFSQAELTRLRNSNQPVLVNMTAAWCITCLANEKVALSSEQLRDYFAANGIVYMKGDWTNQDASITEYLASFGRSSVPLYVYYPPNAGPPRVLPQLLTVATVIDHIEADGQLDKPVATN